MKLSSKITLPSKPEKPPKSIYMLFGEEMRNKDKDAKLTMTIISDAFKSISDKEKKTLEDKLSKLKDQYKKDYSKWLDAAKEKGYPDFPAYPSKVVMAPLSKSDKEGYSKKVFKAMGLAMGAFVSIVKDSLLKYMKDKKIKELTPAVMLKFMDEDPEKFLTSVKEHKKYDEIFDGFKKDCDYEEEKPKKKGKKSSTK